MNITISVLLLGTAVGLIYYWYDFFTKGSVPVIDEDWYIKFEKTFPVADIWTAVCAIIGAVGLLTDNNFGPFFTLLTGSSLLFLGLMDVTFNVQNKLYQYIKKSGQMKFVVFINIWTIGFGISCILLMWSEIV
ncbi:MAG TPA: hypothetical protein G4O15_05715 [Dehalococcoidia bacterium]|nr:hypothetical protein [Dehalococcoidia bacterium]